MTKKKWKKWIKAIQQLALILIILIFPNILFPLSFITDLLWFGLRIFALFSYLFWSQKPKGISRAEWSLIKKPIFFKALGSTGFLIFLQIVVISSIPIIRNQKLEVTTIQAHTTYIVTDTTCPFCQKAENTTDLIGFIANSVHTFDPRYKPLIKVTTNKPDQETIYSTKLKEDLKKHTRYKGMFVRKDSGGNINNQSYTAKNSKGKPKEPDFGTTYDNALNFAYME